MKTLADVDAVFGDAFQDARGREGQPHEHFCHIMLYHELSLMDMFMHNDSNQPREDATSAFMSRVYQGGWFFRMEPAEFLLNYFNNWFSLDDQIAANRKRGVAAF